MIKRKPIPRLCAGMALAIVLGGCSDGNSADIRGVNASYTLIQPEVVASGEETGQALELEVFDVRGAVVELQ